MHCRIFGWLACLSPLQLPESYRMDVPRAGSPQKHKHKKKKHKHKPIKSDPLDIGREYSTLSTSTLPDTPTHLKKPHIFDTPAGEPSSSTSVHSVGVKEVPIPGERDMGMELGLGSLIDLCTWVQCRSDGGTHSR